jgi:hypothetical protein
MRELAADGAVDLIRGGCPYACLAIGLASGMPALVRSGLPRGFPCQIRCGPGTALYDQRPGDRLGLRASRPAFGPP